MRECLVRMMVAGLEMARDWPDLLALVVAASVYQTMLVVGGVVSSCERRELNLAERSATMEDRRWFSRVRARMWS